MSIKRIMILAIVLAMTIAITGCGGDKPDVTEATTEPVTVATTLPAETEPPVETTVETEPAGPYLKLGDLVSITETDLDGKNIVVVKAKITPGWDNETTIRKNYYNVEDLIENQGFDVYDEIQYWAVADMTSSEEAKVVSFTLDSELISAIYNQQVNGISLGDYLDDLWLHPSLQ